MKHAQEKFHRSFNDIADTVDEENEKMIKFFHKKVNQRITLNGVPE